MIKAKALLDQLHEFQSQKDLINVTKARAREEIFTPEIQGELAELDIEFSDKLQAVDKNINTLRTAIKKAMAEEPETVRGDYIMATVGQRTNWNKDKLEILAEANPLILKARSITKVISIKAI